MTSQEHTPRATVARVQGFTVHQVPGIPGLVIAGSRRDWRVCMAGPDDGYDPSWPFTTAIGSPCESLKTAIPYAAQLADERGAS